MLLRKRYHRHPHAVSMLHAHLVFATKYRRRVLSKPVFDILRRQMRASAQKLGASITAIESDGDHVHVLITYPPRLALSRLVQHLKGASSRAVRQKRLPDVIKRLWGKHFWSASYCVISCGGAPLDVVKTYVETQQTRAARPKPNRAKIIHKKTNHTNTHTSHKGALNKRLTSPP